MKKENYVYPCIFREEEGGYLITFPDFPGQVTDSVSEEEAIVSAQEVLALCISHNEDSGIENPKASKQEEISLEENEKLVYIHVWMPYFREAEKIVYVKKTLTIPKWLDEKAKEAKVNFSAVLVRGLKRELGMRE